MVILSNGVDQAGGDVAWINVGDKTATWAVVIKEKGAFLILPAIVAAGRNNIHLFNVILPHIAGVKLARHFVKGEVKGVAQTVGEDFIQTRITAPRKGIIGGDAIVAIGCVCAEWINTQNGP